MSAIKEAPKPKTENAPGQTREIAGSHLECTAGGEFQPVRFAAGSPERWTSSSTTSA